MSSQHPGGDGELNISTTSAARLNTSDLVSPGVVVEEDVYVPERIASVDVYNEYDTGEAEGANEYHPTPLDQCEADGEAQGGGGEDDDEEMEDEYNVDSEDVYLIDSGERDDSEPPSQPPSHPPVYQHRVYNNQLSSLFESCGVSPDYARRGCLPGEGSIDLNQMRAQVQRAREEHKRRRGEELDRQREEREGEAAQLSGVGELLFHLRGEGRGERERVVLDGRGAIVTGTLRGQRRRESKPGARLTCVDPSSLGQLPDVQPAPLPPTDPDELRRLVKSKMIRCKVCRSRFGERNLLERHMRDSHPLAYLEYLYIQELEMNAQKEEEIEQNRIEELTSGGFIPPAEEVFASNYEHVVDGIPLPGEMGRAARFDGNGVIHGGGRRPGTMWRKKMSPQCAFCDKRFRNEYSLKKHMAKKHEECLEYVQCLDCFKCLPDPAALHKDAHECDMSYMCLECVPIRNLCTANRLLAHRAKFHRGAHSGFRCHECNLKFLTPRKLRKHRKMAHVFTKTYPCHFCEELFTSEVSVITHERIHTGIIKFECQVCDYKCSRYSEMEVHKRDEHGYICSICRCRFAEWAEIKNHTLMQHGGYLTSQNNTSYIESPRVWMMFKGD